MTESQGATIRRTFAAPRDLVFDAWVTPRHFATWFGGSDVDVPLDSVSMDVRPGGIWKATMIIGNGVPDMHWFGEFVEVDRPDKLVLTMADRPGDARELVSVTLTEVPDGTEMLFHQSGGNMSADEYERTAAGWQTFFDAMETLVAG
ncbi:MAG TPA: SRPBCC domain-containing protein [Galbitalea sp.]